MIRPANYSDLDAMARLGEIMHQESRFKVLTYDYDKVVATLRWLISEQQFVVVSEQNGEIIGGFVGAAMPHWASPDLVAFDYALFIRPECRGTTVPFRLVREFRRWANERGAKLITAGISTGVHVEKTAALYEAAGFKRIGYLYEGIE